MKAIEKNLIDNISVYLQEIYRSDFSVHSLRVLGVCPLQYIVYGISVESEKRTVSHVFAADARSLEIQCLDHRPIQKEE